MYASGKVVLHLRAVHNVFGYAVQPEAEQEPGQHAPQKEQDVAHMSSAVHAMGLNDRSESTASHFSHSLPQAQPQTSRFEQVFAQSQVKPSHGIPTWSSQTILSLSACR